VDFDYSKGVSRSFVIRAERVQICSFDLGHDPNLVRRTRSGSEQMSEPDIRLTNSDTRPDGGPNPSSFRVGSVRFPGILSCPNVPETPETQKPDRTFQPCIFSVKMT